MPRPKQDPVDRILDAWDAATPEQKTEALRTIKREKGRYAPPTDDQAVKPHLGRPRKIVADPPKES